MELTELVTEAPLMVKQGGYPPFFKKDAMNSISRAAMNPALKETYRDGDVVFKENPSNPNNIYVFFGDEPIGVMNLAQSKAITHTIGKPAYQVMNVFILPEYRNKGIGIKLYNYVLHQRDEAFASGAAMTPASRRIYTSLLGDPSVDVYALKFNRPGDYERIELNKRTRGLTTGKTKLDNSVTFVATAN